MHAEMTVGLDLCSLENLKIFNGYEKVNKETRRSIDSSPEHKPADTDSDDQLEPHERRKKKGRQKCGRPANPIPRHKRQSHIKAEYKRRDKIQKGFDSLVILVPDLRDANASKESKSAMLFKGLQSYTARHYAKCLNLLRNIVAAEYCRRLKGESGNMQSEMAALRQELEALGTEIHGLQHRLPQQGLEVIERESVSMDTLYDQYVQEETTRNWKFWIFGFFMRPLYMSFRQSVSDTSTRLEFSTSLSEWISENLSLTSLRKGFFEALRKISIKTGIMTSPENFEQEAASSVCRHYVQGLPSTPQAPPSPKKPKSEVTTPIPSPVPSTPLSSPTIRSPAVSRRPSTHTRRRESRKSKEPRSRSSTPPLEESRSKRRSSHNRVERQYEQEGSHSGKRSRAASPRTPGIESPYNQSFLVASSSPSNPTALFTPVSLQNGYIQLSTQPGVAEKDLVNALKSLLNRAPQSLVTSQPTLAPATISVHSNTKMVPSFTQSSSQMQQQFIVNELPTSESMDTQVPFQASIQSSQNNQSFMPIEQSGIITNSRLLPLDDNMSSSIHTPPMPDLQSLLTEDSMSCQSSMSLDQICTSVFTTAQPTIPTMPPPRQSSSMLSEMMAVGPTYTPVNPTESACPYNTDEDSLMNMLTMDVMDINSVLTFFSEEEHKTS